MSILRHIVGIASELLTQKDPYDKYESPRIVSEYRDGCGNVAQQTVYAQSHADATAHLRGITIQGDRSIVATRTGHNTWDVHIENWDKNQKGTGMTRSEGYDTNAWSEDYSHWQERSERR